MYAIIFEYIGPSLRDLVCELCTVRGSWYSIGLELGLPCTTLDWFKQEHTDHNRCMTDMLSKWLHVNRHPTWELIITALRSPSINERRLAAKLESKYCAPVQHVMEESEGIVILFCTNDSYSTRAYAK